LRRRDGTSFENGALRWRRFADGNNDVAFRGAWRLLLRRGPLYEGLCVLCAGPQREVQLPEGQHDHCRNIRSFAAMGHRTTSDCDYALKRCTKKRWASGTSHLAVVNSPCAQGLQEPFKAQPKAIARLARKIRCRLETSTPLIAQKRWSQTLAERLTCEKHSPAAVLLSQGELVRARGVTVQEDEIVVTSDTGLVDTVC
jgi:hypothetical protein